MLDEQLKQLAIAAQNHAPQTPERQSALRQLISLVLRSGKLYRPQQGDFPGSYDDIYSEAQQDLFLFVCQNIEQYDPTRASVLTWMNVLLRRRFFREAIPKVLGHKDIRRLNLAEVENIGSAEKTESLSDIVEQCVDADPERLFQSAHIEGCPQVTFQALVKRRIGGLSWKEISAEFDISISTASTFYYRCLQRFSPKLKEYCIGANPGLN